MSLPRNGIASGLRDGASAVACEEGSASGIEPLAAAVEEDIAQEKDAADAWSWVQQVETLLQQLERFPVSGFATDSAAIMSCCAGIQGILDVAEGQGQLGR
jgi:hypothetical protein